MKNTNGAARRGVAVAWVVVAMTWSLHAHAFTVTADGSGVDWALVVPVGVNTGHLTRDSAQRGTFVWRDRLADERRDLTLGNPDPPADLDVVAITGDADNLYVLVAFNQDAAATTLPVQVQLALDLDRVPGSGATYFMGFADTWVPQDAAWEFLVMTRFGSGSAAPAVWNTAEVDVANGAVNAQGADRTIELAVPWANLGLPAGPTAPIAVTLAVFHSDAQDRTLEIGTAAVSNVVDAMTNYGDPRTPRNTWDEVSTDLVIGYHVELWFHLDQEFEPSAPAVISEVAYDTNLTDEEFVELFNRSEHDLELAGWRVGDEETVNETEGMMKFPAGGPLLPAGHKVVVARTWTAYHALYGRFPHFELEDTHPLVPDLARDTTWSSGSMSLANDNDQVLLLDRHHTILDVVAFEAGTYPGVLGHAGTPKGASLQRSPDRRDTDDCTVDFVVTATPTPGQGAETCKSPLAPFDPMPAGTACDDNDPCTSGESCDAAGACAGGAAVVCVIDGNPCTDDACTPAFLGCHAPLTGQSCSDDDVCTGPDLCTAAASCDTATPVVCPAASGCVRAACDPLLGCFIDAGTVCDDQSACTSATLCDGAGGCVGDGTDCSSFDQGCTLGVCDPATGTCGPGSAPNGTPCDDADPCTETDQCVEGACGGAPRDCSSVETACFVGRCEPTSGECQPVPAQPGTACDDGDPCTEGEICQNGACYGGRDVCSPGDTNPTDTAADTWVAEPDDTAVAEPGDTGGSADTGARDTQVLDPGGDTFMADPPPPGADGCGCRVSGQGGALAHGVGVALLALLAWRRRREP